ncbi:DUF1631 family protein [Tamilnaduibacter salinus]|nr:DUF1631 family protein [Tamilnaduibacter salinus]
MPPIPGFEGIGISEGNAVFMHAPDQTPESQADVVDAILEGLRVPELPYPAGRTLPEDAADWTQILRESWQGQHDARVIELLRQDERLWSVRQVNAAYLADRVMDVFLSTSGLHPSLVTRAARLRFLLAWQVNRSGALALSHDNPIHDWLDGLVSLRGWSDSGGRSARQLLRRLDDLMPAVDECFGTGETTALTRFVNEWAEDQRRRQSRIGKLRQRLLETEQGASRQRAADQTARALIGRAIRDRRLPTVILDFIHHIWLPLLRQAIWSQGMESDSARRASRLLEWLVWIGDPTLSDGDRQRLYHVGEKLTDHLSEIGQQILGKPLDRQTLSGLDELLVARIRGESPALETADAGDFDLRWLNPEAVDPARVDALSHQWYVSGSGADEQRRYFFAYLEPSSDVLWTNGEGVKLGVMAWDAFESALERGELKPLPAVTPFGQVVREAVQALGQVLATQKRQREEARRQARERAEAIRRKKEEETRRREAEEQARREAEEKRVAVEAAERQAAEEAEAARQEEAARKEIREAISKLKLGAWIERSSAGADPTKLKLAVRINASRKLVFVDRLGLNRTEMTETDLEERIYEGSARLLSQEAEFEDTLSRVVGRIRVGR